MLERPQGLSIRTRFLLLVSLVISVFCIHRNTNIPFSYHGFLSTDRYLFSLVNLFSSPFFTLLSKEFHEISQKLYISNRSNCQKHQSSINIRSPLQIFCFIRFPITIIHCTFHLLVLHHILNPITLKISIFQISTLKLARFQNEIYNCIHIVAFTSCRRFCCWESITQIQHSAKRN